MVRLVSEPPPDAEGNSATFDEWSEIREQGFQGARVADIKKRRRQQEAQRTDPATIVRGVATRPLVLLFVLLTLGDFVFNFSRQFLCALPDLCEAATY